MSVKLSFINNHKTIKLTDRIMFLVLTHITEKKKNRAIFITEKCMIDLTSHVIENIT